MRKIINNQIHILNEDIVAINQVVYNGSLRYENKCTAADLLLNNRSCDKPKNKSLHLMNDVFYKIGEVDPKIKLLSNAMIDLFVKE